jgi:DNA uptake protein ComE-like DNA-binding protein
MKKQWKTFFYFTRSERSGIVTLVLFCIVLLVIPTFYRYWQPSKTVDFSAFEQLIADTATARRPAAAPRALFYFNPNTLPADSFRLLGLDERTAGSIARYRDKGGRFFAPRDFAKIYTLSTEDYKRLEPYIRIPGAAKKVHRTQEAPARLTWFDPNMITYEDLINLGLPAKTAHIWVNFRKKGGVFRRPEDLRKIYGLSQAQYEQLLPWVRMADAQAAPPAPPAPEKFASIKKTPIRLDINRANTADWEQLDGIGPAFARKITGFRDKLGGFVSIDQVAETRGLPDSVFQLIRPLLDWSPIFQTIDINTADEAALNAHPYINFREARAIVSYRAQHGPFRQIEDLQRLHALPAETLQRIKPYLRL